MQSSDVHIYFDDDGVLHKWNNFTLDDPDPYLDLTPQERDTFIIDQIYQHLLAPDYFRNLPVQQCMADLATALHNQGYHVQALSCSINTDTDRQKYDSIPKCLPWIEKRDIILIPDGKGCDKASYLPMENNGIHILIDDHTPNCNAFERHGYIAVKCKNDINSKGGSWRGSFVYYDDLDASLISIQSIITSHMLLCSDFLTHVVLSAEITFFLHRFQPSVPVSHEEIQNQLNCGNISTLISSIKDIKATDQLSISDQRVAEALLRHIQQRTVCKDRQHPIR